jgi:S-adenosylmethionine:tRNA ribosyltransferase-isomerase
MIVERLSGRISHSQFRSLQDYLLAGDCLVANDVRVIPARLKGYKRGNQAKVEVLLLRHLRDYIWEVLFRPARRVSAGTEINFSQEVSCTVQKTPEQGIGIVEFAGGSDTREAINDLGEMPVPPYIRAPLEDASRYQTIYARSEGAAAAPTAGLHFTEESIDELKRRGVDLAFITLNVGLDTFQPVRTRTVEDHPIHSEYYRVSPQSAELVNRAFSSSKRVVAVGTTSVRVLETVCAEGSESGRRSVRAGEGWTNLFIYPGYQFNTVDSLLTNFHLPKSTLLMLVSAFAGKELTMEAYRKAIEKGYRFFSFGDCMLIV